jgi:hypothetical protein
MNDLYRHQAAQFAFTDALEYHRRTLAEGMRRQFFLVDPNAPVRTLVRLARAVDDKSALHQFEDAIRAPLTAYVEATPKAARTVMLEDAHFLVDHFERFTEVPIVPNPVKRMVSWARRKFRGANRSLGDVD